MNDIRIHNSIMQKFWIYKTHTVRMEVQKMYQQMQRVYQTILQKMAAKSTQFLDSV